MRSPYLSPEEPVCVTRRNRTGQGTTDWFKIWKVYVKSIYCHVTLLI